VEFLKEDFVQAEAIAIARASILDLLILDIEKCENRLERAESEGEKAVLAKCMQLLETEKPLCDAGLTDQEKAAVEQLALLSLKPVVMLDAVESVDRAIEQCLDKAGIVFFYTAGPKEVHAWQVKKDTDIVTCAGRIHTDLARGFIKGDIASFDDFMSCHNWNDCQRKGLVRVVDRDYTIKPGDIIEIRFAV
jgi:ribosome-binding ATPase YchF (GTP1/OBG family)